MVPTVCLEGDCWVLPALVGLGRTPGGLQGPRPQGLTRRPVGAGRRFVGEARGGTRVKLQEPHVGTEPGLG